MAIVEVTHAVVVITVAMATVAGMLHVIITHIVWFSGSSLQLTNEVRHIGILLMSCFV